MRMGIGAKIGRGYRLGCNSYIRKPVASGQFGDAIRQSALYWLGLNVPAPGPKSF